MSYISYKDTETSDFDSAYDHFYGLLEDIYKTGSIKDLEFHLDELCAFFDTPMPKGNPVIEKKPTEENPTTKMLKGWMDLTKAYATKVCGPTRKEN